MKAQHMLGVLALTATASAAAQEGACAPRPNILLIVADDLGYGDLECYGAQRVKTPAVNRLSDEGTRFTNVHAVASTSTPSRYALLTGQYPFRKKGTDIAAGNAGMIIRPEQFTLADALRSRGYRTGAFGKWHLGLGDKDAQQDWNAPLPAGLADIGFDYSYIMAATADRVPCVFIENGQVANWDAEAPIEVSYKEPFPGEPLGRDHPELLTNMRHSHGHDQAIVNGIGRIGYMRGGGRALWKDEDIADSITAHAVDFMRRETATGQPFFMYFATNDVHVPRFPHQRFRGATPMGVRGDAIAEFDWSVGRLLETLDSLGIADNTLVILTSDNGPVVDDGYQDRAEELLGDHLPGGGLRGGKYSAFEAGTNVPAIVRWPAGGVPAGQESTTLMSHIDLPGSLAALAGTRLPKGAMPDSEPQALEAWLGQPGAPDRPWVVEMASDHTLSLRTPRWKYIEPSQGPAMVPWGPKIETGYQSSPQLYEAPRAPRGNRHAYDTGADQERRNVAPEHPRAVEELQGLLDQIRRGE